VRDVALVPQRHVLQRRDHRGADDPNVVVIAFRVADLKRAQEFVGSETLRSAMQQAGVQGPPEIWFAEDIEDKRYS
jgi:hypothetical protein